MSPRPIPILLFQLVLPILLALCHPTASLAGVACGQDRACEDARVGRLDEAMGKALRLAVSVAPDPKALKAAQAQWRRTVLERCADRDCRLAAYQARIADLGRLFATTAPVSDRPLDADGAEAACEAVAGLADRRRLYAQAVPGVDQWPFADAPPPAEMAFTAQDKARLQARDLGWPAEARTLYLLRPAPDAEPMRFGSFFTGGACPAYQTFSLPALLDGKGKDLGIEPVRDPRELIRWAYLGASDYPIVHQGRNLIITADLGNPDKVNMVSWVKPDGRIRPLCLLKTRQDGLRVASARLPRVCDAVAKGEVRPLKWRDAAEVPPFSRRLQGHRDEFVRRYGDDAEDIGLLRVDIDRDGKADRLARFRHTAAVGCGVTRVWWSVLTGDLGGVQHGALNTQLQALDDGAREVYKVDGHYYLAASRQGQPGLFQINRGRTEQVCAFRQDTRTRVTTMFPVD